ncbi:EMSY domain-containing protein [Tanacetum coccineum]
MKYKKEANRAMFGVLPKENAAIIDFYLKDCCFDTHNNHHLKRASPCFYSQRKINEERPLKSRRLGTSTEKVDDVINNRDMKENINGSETDSVVSSSGSCSINSHKLYDMYCRSVHDSDAESACQSGYHEDSDQSFTNETLADEIHRQELNAYRSTIKALHASGPLTWEKETMVTDLRLLLHISNDEYLIMLKNLNSSSSSCRTRRNRYYSTIRPKYWLVRLLLHQLVDVGTMWEGQKYFCYMCVLSLILVYTINLELLWGWVNGQNSYELIRITSG